MPVPSSRVTPNLSAPTINRLTGRSASAELSANAQNRRRERAKAWENIRALVSRGLTSRRVPATTARANDHADRRSHRHGVRPPPPRLRPGGPVGNGGAAHGVAAAGRRGGPALLGVDPRGLRAADALLAAPGAGAADARAAQHHHRHPPAVAGARPVGAAAGDALDGTGRAGRAGAGAVGAPA